MTRSYKNITDYLTEIGYNLSTEYNEYISRWKNDKRNFRFEYTCPDGHITESSLAIYNNSKTQLKKETRKELCSKCNGGKGVKHNAKFEDKKRFIFQNTGHTLIKITRDRKCEYICGNCGEIATNDTSNLTRKQNTKCIKCRYLKETPKTDIEKSITMTIKEYICAYIENFMKNVSEKYEIPYNDIKEIFLDIFILDSIQKRIRILKTEFSQENTKEFEKYKTNEKIKWKCRKNSLHIWETRLYGRLNQNTECPYCTGTKVMYNSENSLAISRPDLLKEWDYSLNKKIDPKNVSLQTDKKVWWKCDKNHTWQNTIRSRVNKKCIDCPYCSNRKVLPGFNSIKVLYPTLLKEWDYFLNKEIIDPDNILPNSKIKVWWKCTKGHSWQVSSLIRVRDGTGCPYCKNRKILPDHSNSLEYSSPDIMKEWDYSLNKEIIDPKTVTLGSNISVYWKCEKGHSWKTSIRNRVNKKGIGCSECKRLSLLVQRGSLAEKYPKLLSEWDYTKNVLTPEQIFSSTNKKFWWKCEKGHSWESSPNNRTGKNSRNCPVCKQSKGEKIICEYLDKNYIKYISQYKISFEECERLFYDFNLLEYNLFIEFDGIQHFEIIPVFGDEEGFSIRYRNDIYKNSYATKNGYRLLRIHYLDIDKIDRILSENIPKPDLVMYSESYPKNWF